MDNPKDTANRDLLRYYFKRFEGSRYAPEEFDKAFESFEKDVCNNGKLEETLRRYSIKDATMWGGL